MKAFINDAGTTAYCGPTIVGAITGLPLTKVRDAIRASDEKRGLRTRTPEGRLLPIKGVTTGQIKRVFEDLGYKVEKLNFRPRKEDGTYDPQPTLAAFLRKRTPEQRKQTMIIVVGKRYSKPRPGLFGYSYSAWHGGHWVAITGKKLVDTFTKGEWVWLSKAPHRRKRVSEVWTVTKA